MNVLDPQIAYLEMDRRLRAAEHRRRVRRMPAAAKRRSTTAAVAW
jgi:hypothetical protein